MTGEGLVGCSVPKLFKRVLAVKVFACLDLQELEELYSQTNTVSSVDNLNGRVASVMACRKAEEAVRTRFCVAGVPGSR